MPTLGALAPLREKLFNPTLTQPQLSEEGEPNNEAQQREIGT